MKILVAVKRVIDYNVKARVKSDQSDVDLTNVKMAMNPFDEIAVEEAVRLKEKNIATEIVVVSIGPSQAQETLRSALALGADKAILVESDQSTEPLIVAKILQKLIDREQPQLVILGKQAIDDDCNQTGQMLAGLLSWPQGTFISELKIENAQAHITREVDGGLEKLKLSLPAVLTTDLRLNVPRYPALPNIMKAKQKPLETLAMSTLGVDAKRSQKILKVSEPAQRKKGIRVASVEDLIQKLHQEAGVI